jgi:hypothetical protein
MQKDDAAKERAQQLVAGHDVELWQRERRIARFESEMNEPRPIFTARKKTPPAIGWTVEATWPNGQIDKIEGFSSEAKAVKSIAEQSESWLGNNTT